MFQEYSINVLPQNYVIKGNDAILKCEVPSFVGDLIEIVGWVDSSEKDYLPHLQPIGKNKWQQLKDTSLSDTTQFGIKLIVFVLLTKSPFSTVVFQDFNINVPRETYGILGNDAIIKCEVPSFVADLVSVTSWTDTSGKSIPHSFGNKWCKCPLRLFMTPTWQKCLQ